MKVGILFLFRSVVVYRLQCVAGVINSRRFYHRLYQRLHSIKI